MINGSNLTLTVKKPVTHRALGTLVDEMIERHVASVIFTFKYMFCNQYFDQNGIQNSF